MAYLPDVSQYSSWTEEHRAAVEDTMKQASGGGCVALLGNLESSPSATNVDARAEDNFQLVFDAGFEEPWTQRRCTFCEENPLIWPEGDLQLDHVMLRSCPDFSSVSYTRILDEPITVTDRLGKEHTTRLSAHYGLKLEVR